jgi:hypothetical protein
MPSYGSEFVTPFKKNTNKIVVYLHNVTSFSMLAGMYHMLHQLITDMLLLLLFLFVHTADLYTLHFERLIINYILLN